MPFQKWNEKPEPGSTMSKSKPSNALLQKAFAVVITALVIGGLASTLRSAEPKPDVLPPKADSTPSGTNSVDPKGKLSDARKAAGKKQLTGAELYSMHCN